MRENASPLPKGRIPWFGDGRPMVALCPEFIGVYYNTSVPASTLLNSYLAIFLY